MHSAHLPCLQACKIVQNGDGNHERVGLRTGSFARELGKIDKKGRGGRGRERENEPARMTFNLESFVYRFNFSMLKS